MYLLSRAEFMRHRGDTNPRLTPEIVERAMADAPTADPDAVYAKEIEFDLSAVTPFVAGPNEVKTITPLPEIEQRRVRIDKAYLLSCVNGRLEDFAEAAAVLEGKKVADGVTFYIAAASSEVEAEATRLGHWGALVETGAVALPPGCGPCIGLGEGVLEGSEVGISATNRNFTGRMGSRDSQVYLASPAVVASSAVAGYIAGPPSHGLGPVRTPTARRPAAATEGDALRESLERGSSIQVHPLTEAGTKEVTVLEGFPARIEGELLYVPKDNMNTDGIYGKEFTYKDDLTPEQMGTKAMLNYDSRFQEIAQDGDILVGGYNFGSGSSREQAATALKYRGLQMIIAGSYSQTYKRNAFNNGYIVIECPELIEELQTAHAGDDTLTIRTGKQTVVDFVRGQIAHGGKAHRFAPLGEVAQELITKGGFEEVIRGRILEKDP